MKAQKALFLFALAWVVIPGSALAVRATDNTAANVSTTIRNCERMQNRLQNKQSAYSKSSDAHTQAYDNMLTRLTRFSTNIKAKGYDTAKLDLDIATLTSKINEFKTLIASPGQTLEQIISNACTAEGSSIKDQLRALRSNVRETHQKAAEIRNYYRTVVRPDLLALKEQHPGSTSNTTNQDAASNSTAE